LGLGEQQVFILQLLNLIIIVPATIFELTKTGIANKKQVWVIAHK